MVASLSGVTAFVVFLLLAVQVCLDLFATSAVTAAAYDAARVVAGADAGQSPHAMTVAEADARRSLGHYGARIRFHWVIDERSVRLRVIAVHPRVLPTAFSRPLGIDVVDRTLRVRTETFT
jgi:hypothetical protein